MIKLEPQINWLPFDKCMPPADLCSDTQYLIFLREDDYDNGATWHYSVDIATPYGRYLDDFWDTENDWKEGQRVEVLAYAELPYYQKEEELVDRSCMVKDPALKGLNNLKERLGF